VKSVRQNSKSKKSQKNLKKKVLKKKVKKKQRQTPKNIWGKKAQDKMTPV